MSAKWPNRGAGAFTAGGRKVVLLTEREAAAVLERLHAVMSHAEQGTNSDLGRAARVLGRQLEWLQSETRGSGRARVDRGAA